MQNNEIILVAKNLTLESRIVQFDGTEISTTLVDNVSFSMKKGRVLGIVGESGSGKTLSAKTLMGILPKGIHLQSGSVEFFGKELPIHDSFAMQDIRGKSISMLFQDPMLSFNPLHKIGKQIGESLIKHTKCSTKFANQKAEHLLEKLGIEDPIRVMNSFPHQLSGGQRQRAMLAMAIITEPAILIADEPTTAIDATIQLQVIELLKSVKDSVSLIIISHDLNLMKSLADDLYIMQEGKIVEEGLTQEIFENPKHDYSKMLLNKIDFALPPALTEDAQTILTVDKLNVHYQIGMKYFWKETKYVHAVNDVSFDLKAGECLGIVGESGSGKSSLGLALIRLIQAEGSCNFMGTNLLELDKENLRKLRKNIQMVFQASLAALNPRLSIYQSIAEGIKAHNPNLPEQEIELMVSNALESVELSADLRHRYPHEFSGGQCQRICIARALAMKPKCIIFDEPTSSLDRNTQFQIIQLIKKLQEQYALACLFITHDLSLIRGLAHKVMVMKQGVVVENASTQTVFQNPQHRYTKLLINAANLI